MYSSLLIQIALLATAEAELAQGCVQLSRAKRELPEGKPCRDKRVALERGELGDWARKPPSRPPYKYLLWVIDPSVTQQDCTVPSGFSLAETG